jgi:hypothetical protein
MMSSQVGSPQITTELAPGPARSQAIATCATEALCAAAMVRIFSMSSKPASLSIAERRARSTSELLDPGPKLHFPRPRAARLLKDMKIGRCDGIRIEHRIRLGCLLKACDASIDHEVHDMYALGTKLARETLGKSSQGEFTHCEGCRAGIALDTGRCPRKDNCAATAA